MSADQFRANSWDEYVGQEELKRTIRIHLEAAINGERRMLHTLLTSGPGYGKSALANIVGCEYGYEFQAMTMPITPTALAETLRWMGRGVVFLDEIHRAPKAQQEDLLSALQDGVYQTKSREGIDVSEVCFIAATTEPDKVIPPLYDRFELKPTFERYSEDDMSQILRGMGQKIDLDFPDEVVEALRRTTGGTPRVARTLVTSARSLRDTGMKVEVDEILRLSGLDLDGLSRNHLDYLGALAKMKGVAGVDKIQSVLQMPKSTLLDVERLLLERNYITYGQTGRELLNEGYRKLKSRK